MIKAACQYGLLGSAKDLQIRMTYTTLAEFSGDWLPMSVCRVSHALYLFILGLSWHCIAGVGNRQEKNLRHGLSLHIDMQI